MYLLVTSAPFPWTAKNSLYPERTQCGQDGFWPSLGSGLMQLVEEPIQSVCRNSVQPIYSVTITSDASFMGWWVHLASCPSTTIQGKWTSLRQPPGIKSSLEHLSRLSSTLQGLICKNHDREHSLHVLHKPPGGVRSPSLSAKIIKLWNWCIAIHILISVS